MRKFTLAAAAIFAAAIPCAAGATVPQTCNTLTGLGLPSPNAISCVGYYTGNLLNQSNASTQQSAIDALETLNGLPHSVTVNWPALAGASNPWFVLDSDPTTQNPGLTNGNQLNFGQLLSGYTIVGTHWGNIPDPSVNPNNNGRTGNVTVFWLFNLTTPTDHISLDDTQGWSNSALYLTSPPPPAVPEPATWAMLIAGFGATGFAMRRTRRKNLLAQIA